MVAMYCSISSLYLLTPYVGALLINQWLLRFNSRYSAIAAKENNESSRISEYKYVSSEWPVSVR